MIIKANDFFKQIQQNQLQSCYLLHGTEEYAKDQALQQLIDTSEESVRDFNVLTSENSNADEWIESCEVLPVMDERRIVISKYQPWFEKSDEDVKRVIEYLKQSNPMTCIVFFVRGQADARNALYKAVNQVGTVVAFEHYTEREASQWAVNYAKRRGYALPEALALELVNMVSVDVGKIAQEVDKLCDFAGENKTISKQMLQMSVMPDLEYTVFEMLECFLSGNLAKGMTLLDETILREGAGSLFMLISFFSGRIRNMWIGKMALAKGQSMAQAQKSIGGNAYAAKKSLQAAQHFNLEKLESALFSLSNLDKEAKTGQIKLRPAFEIILLNLFS